MGPFVRREVVTRRLLSIRSQYSVDCTPGAGQESDFRFAQSLWHGNSVLRSKYTCTIRLNTDAYLCAVIARRNLRRSTARPMGRPMHHASQGCIPRRSCIVGHVSSPGSHAFAHGTPHTEHGAHAPMNTPNEHPHGCHTSAHPIPSSLARCCPPTPDHTHFFLGGVSGRLPNPNLAFSAGLRMRKEHMRLSSMVITAPALSNSPQ